MTASRRPKARSTFVVLLACQLLAGCATSNPRGGSAADAGRSTGTTTPEGAGGGDAAAAEGIERPDDEAPGLENRIRWKTASEVENFGFDVYRATSEDGPFERITEDPVLGAGTTDEETAYEFVDHTVVPDTAYWYYVESISLNGERERFTPIFRAPPKSAPDEDGGH